ncbi:MAG: hypothetical protein HOV87_01710 [Catenulispora sp.]|nr:hypothetical protein [Catenulispora sp.]
MPATTPSGMPDTDPGQDLLRLLADRPDVAHDLDLVADFDITRRDPVENLSIPAGLPLTVIAGDASGGSYYLVGDEPAARRPVLYADSEGGASLIAADLAEAVAIFIALAWWRDATGGTDLAELEAEIRENEPDIDELRDRLLAATGVPAISPEQARELLLAAAARTAPDFVPIADFDGASPYELLFTPSAQA